MDDRVPDDDLSPIDFSALDPARKAARVDRFAAAVAERAAPELARRRDGGAALARQVVTWRRGVVTASVLAMAASLALFILPGVRTPAAPRRGDTAAVPTSPTATTSTPATLTEAMGVPAALAPYVERGGTVSGDALLFPLATIR